MEIEEQVRTGVLVYTAGMVDPELSQKRREAGQKGAEVSNAVQREKREAAKAANGEPDQQRLGPQEQSDHELALEVLRWEALKRKDIPPYARIQAAKELHNLSREVEADSRIDTITRIIGAAVSAQVEESDE